MNPRLLLIPFLAGLAPLAAGAILEATALPQDFTPDTTGAGAIAPWPAGVTSRFEFRTITLTREHQPETFLRLMSGSLTLQLRQSDLDDWQVQREGTYSLNLDHRWYPTAKAYLVWFPRGRYLSSLDESPWRGHLQGVLGRYPGAVRFEFNDDSQSNTQMLQVMGRRTRLLGYETNNPDAEGEVGTTLQIWVEFDDGILVYGLTGPTRVVLQARSDFSRLATSMDVVTAP